MKQTENIAQKKILLSKGYLKSYEQRFKHDIPLKKQLIKIIELFIENRKDTTLKDHALSGPMHGKRSFSINPDVRIIYKETSEHIVFLDIGNHEQVYIK